MSNLRIEAPQVEGSLMPYIDQGEPCSHAVELVTGPGLSPPAVSLNIIVETKAGKIVNIIIPNEASTTAIARVRIDGKEV